AAEPEADKRRPERHPANSPMVVARNQEQRQHTEERREDNERQHRDVHQVRLADGAPDDPLARLRDGLRGPPATPLSMPCRTAPARDLVPGNGWVRLAINGSRPRTR